MAKLVQSRSEAENCAKKGQILVESKGTNWCGEVGVNKRPGGGIGLLGRSEVLTDISFLASDQVYSKKEKNSS